MKDWKASNYFQYSSSGIDEWTKKHEDAQMGQSHSFELKTKSTAFQDIWGYSVIHYPVVYPLLSSFSDRQRETILGNLHIYQNGFFLLLY